MYVCGATAELLTFVSCFCTLFVTMHHMTNRIQKSIWLDISLSEGSLWEDLYISILHWYGKTFISFYSKIASVK